MHGQQNILKKIITVNLFTYCTTDRSQWPRGLRRGSAAARLLRLWVRIRPEALMSVCCECCVLSGRRFSDELITRPEESYRLWCVAVCDLETSWMMSCPTGGCCAKNKLYNEPLESVTITTETSWKCHVLCAETCWRIDSVWRVYLVHIKLVPRNKDEQYYIIYDVFEFLHFAQVLQVLTLKFCK